MDKRFKIFTINPGSTSTKIALFENDRELFRHNVSHDSQVLSEFTDILDQLPYRKEMIMDILLKEGISLNGIDAFVGRGGGLLPVTGGTYEINGLLISHATQAVDGITHPARIGSLLANEFAQEYGGSGFVVNPPCVDEFEDLARITGLKGIYRASHIHALNQKETAIRHAESLGKKYEDCNFIVCHMGGGISITAHKKGKMVDSNDIVGGDGPMTPTRCGSVPATELIRLCFSDQYGKDELLDKFSHNGGFSQLLGTSDTIQVSQRAEMGDEKAQLYWDAMIYQIIKYIGSMATVLSGKVDGILLGGGMAHSEYLVEKICQSCSFIALITTYPGEFEMEAMAAGALRVLTGKESAKIYTGEPVWKPIE